MVEVITRTQELAEHAERRNILISGLKQHYSPGSVIFDGSDVIVSRQGYGPAIISEGAVRVQREKDIPLGRELAEVCQGLTWNDYRVIVED